MTEPPEQAQASFVEDIAPELKRKAELSLWKQRPGALEFAAIAGPSAGIGRRGRLEPHPVRLGPRIHVTFEPYPLGTRVTIRGRCEREFCDALALLGHPGRWPDTKNDPHG